MIFYFSATGNSLYVAKRIARKEKLISISDAVKNDNCRFFIDEHESIGFIMPSYFSGIPNIVEEFISKLELSGNRNNYIFLILTCGITTGNAGAMFQKMLSERGYRLSAQYAVLMVDTYVPMFPIPNPEKEEQILKNADIEINTIENKIKEQQVGDFNEVKGFCPTIMSAVMHSIYKHGRKTKKFTVSESCTNCGLCKKICPCDAIQIKDGKPKWTKNNCVMCLGCLHRCPKSAIQYGNNTQNHGQYVNKQAGL